jgi:hypothetical protein
VPRPWLEEPDGVGSRNTAEERKEKRACDYVCQVVQSLHVTLSDLGIAGVYVYRLKAPTNIGNQRTSRVNHHPTVAY